MHRRGMTCALGCLVLGLVLSACGGEKKDEAAAEQVEELAWLKQAKETLDAERARLAELRQTQADSPAQEGEASAEGGSETVDVAAQLRELEARVNQLTDEFGQRLVEFINADPPVEGEPLDDSQIAAIRMKSSEDMVIAREYIEKGGDYRRAIDIYRQAMILDPDNPDLMAALQRTEDLRFMTEERFKEVRKGMTREQVRERLGPVNLRNIREYPEKNVLAWLYPKEDGGAAAVWFEKSRRRDQFEVYKADFNEIKPTVVGPGGEQEVQ